MVAMVKATSLGSHRALLKAVASCLGVATRTRSFISTPTLAKSLSETLEQTLARLDNRLLPTFTEDSRSSNQKDIHKVLRQMLDSRIERSSSDPALNSHFQDLFQGLGTITQSSSEHRHFLQLPARKRTEHLLRSEHTEADVLRLFDVLYYNGLVSPRVAVEVLRDARVHNFAHVAKLVTSGGTLIKWPWLDKQLFQLHVANKLWLVGERTQAKRLVTDQFNAAWLPHIDVLERMSPANVRLFLRAVLAVQDDLEVDLAHALQERKDWSTLYLLWATSEAQNRSTFATALLHNLAEEEPVFGVLAELAAHKPDQTSALSGLRPVLRLVPRGENWRQQVGEAIVAAARDRSELHADLVDRLWTLDLAPPAGARLAALKLSMQ